VNDFLHAGRLRAWCRILAIGMALWAAMTVLQAVTNTGGARADLAVDFTCSYSAGRLALQGRAASAYDVKAIYTEQHADRAMSASGVEPMYYPPPYLLLCLPLGLLPYWWALALFLAAGFVPLLIALRTLLPQGVSLLPALAFPGMLVNAGSGQNGFFSAACFAWFTVWADTRPYLAGACFGLLACKPHFAMLAPLALLVAGRWRAIAGAALTFTGICLLSLAVFGPDTWLAFFDSFRQAGRDLTGGVIDQTKIQSTFMAVRLLGGGLPVAAVIQAAVSLAAIAVLIRFARRRASGRDFGAVLTASALLGTPYLCDYDLVCMAPALAVGLARGVAEGWRKWDKLFLLAAYLSPLLTRGVASRTGLQLAPVAMAMLLAVVARPPKPALP